MLLAEDLLLLVTNDATGRLSVSGEPVDAGLAVLTLLSQAAEEQGGRARAQSSPAGHGGAPAERWDWDDLD